MISLLEVWERAQGGKIVEEKEWNMGLFRKLTELTGKYRISRQKQEWINTDDEILERVYEAAVEFICEYGVYCRDLRRVIRFSEAEVRQAVAEAPGEVEVGEGAERRTITHKGVEDRRKRNVMGGGHAPFSHELIPLVVKSFVSALPRIDYMDGMNFKEIEGREISNVGIASYAQIKAIEAQREGLMMAGKPGIAVTLYPISTDPVCLTAPLGMTHGLRRGDGALLSPLPDCKVESTFLTTAIVYQQYGLSFLENSSDGYCGGTFVGSPQNAIVENVAKVILAWMCYRCTLHNASVKHTHEVGGKCLFFDEVSWASSVATQTVNRCTPFITVSDAGFLNEIGTRELFHEIAVKAIRDTVSGGNVWLTQHHVPKVDCGASPLESLFHLEVADAVSDSGLTREHANDLGREWAEELHRAVPPAPAGRSIAEVFDLAEGRPRPEPQRNRDLVAAELAARGLPLP